jgi:Mrp family chromosome partitioning ATPase
MAESPSRGGPPNADDAGDGAAAKKGESDPLFNPPGLKQRRTVMGLAPAPHLGGANRPLSDAEQRKQRVLARIAAVGEAGDDEEPTLFRPSTPGETRLVETDPPPRMPSAAPPRPTAPPTYGSSTVIMAQNPLAGSRAISSDRNLPASAGWDVHPQQAQVDAPEVPTEVMEPAPITARMPKMASNLPIPAQTSAMAPPAAALALRTYEPAFIARPSLGHLTDSRLVIVSEPNSERAGSYRLLRDNLLSKGMPRVLAISSATPGDGKTTCAVNLALSLAELSSTRVLLIDANFFEPELGTLFAIERLSPIIPPDGNAAWLEPYKLVEITAGLHVAGVVRRLGEPAPRFEQQRFEAMIDRLVRVSYDYILIDTPAIRRTPAVIQLVATADATLMAVRAGATAGRDLRRAIEQIPQKKAFGIALIDAPTVE